MAEAEYPTMGDFNYDTITITPSEYQGITSSFTSKEEDEAFKELEKAMKNWHKSNLDSLYVTNISGIKIPMPKYYRDKIFTDDERKEIVRIVSNEMDRQFKEAINDLGTEDYHNLQKTTRRQAEKIFRKKMKNRDID